MTATSAAIASLLLDELRQCDTEQELGAWMVMRLSVIASLGEHTAEVLAGVNRKMEEFKRPAVAKMPG